MRTGIATVAVLLYVVVASDRASEGRAGQAPPTPAPAPATAQAPNAAPVSPQRALGVEVGEGGAHRSGTVWAATASGSKRAAWRCPDWIWTRSTARRDRREGDPQAARRSDAAGRRQAPGQSVRGRVRLVAREQDRRGGAPIRRPGRVPLRRLNRREYANAVRDLIGLNVDAKALLPDDNVKGHFDNNAAALQVSPNFIDQYIYAARAVALEAIGNPKAPPITDHLRRRRQHGDLAAAERRARHRPPAASSRRDAVRHARRLHRRAQLPGRRRIRAHDRRHGAGARSAADGVREHGDRAARRQGVLPHEYRRRRRPQGDRSAAGSRGRRDQRTAAEDPLQGHGRAAQAGGHLRASQLRRKRRADAHERARGRAGAHPGRACAADPRAAGGHRHEPVGQPREDLHLPAGQARATRRACAQKIVENLARRAFRRPVTAEDVAPLMAFYKSGHATGGFDGGVRDALSAILASPHFLYRAEAGDAAGGDSHAERSRAGVAPVLLPVEQPAGRRAADAGHRVAPQQARRAGRAGEPDAGRPARQVAQRRLRVPVAARRQAGRDHAGPGPVPARERPAGSARAVEGGAAAVHRQRPAQRSQRRTSC